MADRLDHRADVGITGRLGFDKARRAPLVSTIQIDPLKEDTMEMEVQIDRTPETLDECHRPWLDVGSLTASCDGFVYIILPDRGADDRMNLRGQLLGRRHPIPQGDRHRHDPLADGDPGDDPLN